MKKYDFDQVIDRRESGALKCDALQSLFGKTGLTPLWVADLDFAVCPDITEALMHRVEHPVYGYASTPDSYWQSIIDWLGHRHDFKVSREELAFVPGVVRGVAYALNYFTNRGDKVLIQQPVYHPFKMVIEGNERVVVNNPLKINEKGYEMDLDGLRQVIETEHPKMMVLCNPHNPIGIQWDADVMREVAHICRENGVVVVSDEIHGDLMLYGKPHIPFVSVSDDAKAITITLGAPSKTFNIPGLVSSWMVVKDEQLRNGFYHWMETNEFSSPTMFATIGAEVAYTHGEEWLNQMLAYIEETIDVVNKFLIENVPQIKMFRPQASFLLWLDCRDLNLSQAQLVNLFVDKARLALNDGTMFGKEGEGFMRLNIGSPRKVIVEALQRLADAVKSLK
ncbi:MAG: PatB family C-S lyase [Muribaculaceae bacterium]|nr:PatB family C-S lyase [Muribaculaceae bacterium]